MAITFIQRFFLFLGVFLVLLVIINANAQKQIDKPNSQGFSESLIEQDVISYKEMRERELIPLTDDTRKKLRYFYKFFETRIFILAINHLEQPTHKYVFVLYHSFVLFSIYIVSLGLFNFRKNRLLVNDLLASLLFLLIVSYLFASTKILVDERFTLIETLAVSLALYASLNQRVLMFIASVFLGVSNRESSIALGIFYPLINYKLISKLKQFALISSGFIFLLILNYDILLNIDLDFIFYSTSRYNRFSGINIISYVIKYGLFLLPLTFMLFSLAMDDIICSKVLILFLVWLLIIFFGSYLGNTALLSIFIPFYLFTLGQYLNTFQSK